MLFSSVIFLLYFLPVFLIVYYITPKNKKNITLLLFSIFFYSWGAPKFIFVIFLTTFLDYFLVRYMDKQEDLVKKKVLLALSVGINLGLLAYFKYVGFFIENVNAFLQLLGSPKIKWLEIALPLGISFYTFETITYVVDVYRKQHKPLNNFWDYQVYIMMFPKLIAGPIVRYHDLASQINANDRTNNNTIDDKILGLIRFIIGLSKKVIIANQMGTIAETAFNGPITDLNSSSAWLGILAYTFQIYFDFSGYSDMAIGISRMIGFKIPENFNNPYTAVGITDFWRRWHISVSSWMKNYLYIPLGGNRVNSNSRLYTNLIVVFLISGLWHGASWNFVLWGLYHGVFLVLERLFLLKVYAFIGKIPSVIFSFIIVMLGWVLFRTETLSDAYLYIHKMFEFNLGAVEITNKTILIFVLAIFFSFVTLSEIGKRIESKIYFSREMGFFQYMLILPAMIFLLYNLSVLTAVGFNPFIYFRF